LLLTAVLTLPASAQLGFPNVELGEIDTECVSVCFGDVANCDDGGTINQVTIEPPFHVRGLRLADADDDFCANQTGITTRVLRLPVTLAPGQVLVFDVDMVADQIGNFSEPLIVNGGEVTDVDVNVLAPGPCAPSATDTLCLQDNRFAVRSFWRTAFGTRGNSPKVQGVNSDDSGLFYFFNQDNWEMLVKVLDGCGVNNHYWVFNAAATNVEYWLTVTDTQTAEIQTYFNPLNMRATAIQDLDAFATCP
jgi:hypothetical protein